jgi:hypothetical protein
MYSGGRAAQSVRRARRGRLRQIGALVRGVRPAAKFVIMWLPGCLSWMIGVCESFRAAEPW